MRAVAANACCGEAQASATVPAGAALDATICAGIRQAPAWVFDSASLACLPTQKASWVAPAPSSLVFEVGTPLAEVEQRMIRETLKRTDGDKSLAAQLLGISTRTIYRKLDEGSGGAA